MAPLQFASVSAVDQVQQHQAYPGLAPNAAASTVLLFSVMLRAALYIRDDGELRVNASQCPGQQYPETNRLQRFCGPPAGAAMDTQVSSICKYMSHDGEFLLAMDLTTGMLTTVQTQLQSRAAEHGICVQFEEVAMPSSNPGAVPGHGDSVQLVGFADGRDQHPVVLSGRPVTEMDICRTGVEPFMQVTRRDDNTMAEARHFVIVTPGDVIRHSASQHRPEQQQECGDQIRSSYPLLWSSDTVCADSEDDGSDYDLDDDNEMEMANENSIVFSNTT
ncbi:uncharacterized protein LOC135829708 [Sycon ciliatum]|uniref:uncharacterized protein LOC135829708 n=1 Tax=Sycon ciliatum TaxID=27933 RepID=UPI0031F7116B